MQRDYLVLEKLEKIFGNGDDLVRAVDNIDLNVKEGELITLLGPSGCGKTTTLRMIAGFQSPSGGDILIDGKSVNLLPPNKRPTSMVFQNYALFPHMTAKENISYGLKAQGVPRDEMEQRVAKIMQLMGLEGLGDRQPRQLSGGQQQRISLARAMVMEPKVLLFDEPLSNLDAKLRVSTRLEIRKLQQRVGITSVYVTHDQEEAMTLSDRVVIMESGQIQQVGTPQEIYAHPANKFVAGFIGKANFLECSIKGLEDEHILLDFKGTTIRAPRWNKDLKEGDEVLNVVRPEAMDLEDPSPDLMEGTVLNSVYFGSQMLYEVMIADDQVLVIEVPDPQYHKIFAEGTKVGLRLKEKSLHVLKK